MLLTKPVEVDIKHLTNFRAMSCCHADTWKKIFSSLLVCAPLWQVFYWLKDMKMWRFFKGDSLMFTAKEN